MDRRQFLLTATCAALAACGATPQAPALPTAQVATPVLVALPTLVPTTTPIPRPTPPATISAAGDTWQRGERGVEQRQLSVVLDAERSTSVVIVRLDVQQIRLRVRYDPTQPLALRGWFLQHPALVMVNGGFFTEDYRTTALLISNGTAHGESYVGFGGMLAADSEGGIQIQALREQPYDPGQVFTEAVQSFPMLVFPGGRVAELTEDGQQARRTVAALDNEGRLLLMVAPSSRFSLRELADWLVGSNLGIDRALNLDGGSSSGMFVRAGSVQQQIDSFAAVPSILAVEPRP